MSKGTTENGAFSEATSPLTKNIGRARTILDLGGRLGAATPIAEGRGARVTSVDAAAREIPAGRFDLIACHDAVERAEEPIAFVKRLAGCLEDGGHMLVDMPTGRGAFRSDNAVRVLEDAGLEVMRVSTDPVPHPLVRMARIAEALFTKKHVAPEKQVIVARAAPKRGKLSLTVGMLTLNEKESIGKMIDEIRGLVGDAKILVIDSSSDETPDIARARGARVVRQLPARGHAPAMHRLMYEAADESDALIYIDCDFTYPASAIPRIRELLEAGADVVNTTRTHRYQAAMPVPNFFANRFFAATAQAIHGVPTTDVHSGMRGYRSSVIRAFDFNGGGDAMPLDTLILPARSHYHVAELPIQYFNRQGTSKLAKLRGTTWTFIRIASAIGDGSRVRAGVRYRHVDE